MDYNSLASCFLRRVFDNSAITDLEQFIARLPPESAQFASGNLTQSEWRRLRWSYWNAAHAVCIAAWGNTYAVYDLDKDQIPILVKDAYPKLIPNDRSSVRVGDYLPNRLDVRALKRSRAVACAFYNALENQTATLGTLARALATHRLTTLLGAYVEGCRISRFVDTVRNDSGEPTGFFAEMLSGGMTNRTKDGLSRMAMVLGSMILDCGEFRNDQKSLDASDTLFGILEQSYKNFVGDIAQHASGDA